MSLDPTIEDKYVTVDGRRIRYLEKGSGRPLLLLHGMGFTLSADMWLAQLEPFAAFSHVYALDIPGWGLSDPLPDPTFPAWAVVVKGFCDALGLTELDVFGYSIGGWISALFARDNPQMVRRMMLLDAPGMNLPAPNFVANFQLPSRDKVKEDLVLHTPGYASEAQVDQLYARVTRPGAEAAYRAAGGHVVDPDARKAHSLHTVFPELKMPLLIAQMDNANGVLIRYIFEAYMLAPHARMLIYYGGNNRLVGGIKAVPQATAIEFFTADEVSVPPAK